MLDGEEVRHFALGTPPRLGDPRLDQVLDQARVAMRVEWGEGSITVRGLDGTRHTRFLDAPLLARLRAALA
ncbi:MAG: hypothetical protein Q7U06_01155 [Pseudomonadota bacterium]|nr:hypothetical protein [Pseudomonadota bacterium]